MQILLEELELLIKSSIHMMLKPSKQFLFSTLILMFVIWKHSNDRQYLVCSSYHHLVEHTINNDYLKVSGSQSLLWNLKVSPKVKHFFVESPSKLAYIVRSYCNTNLENSWHVFFLAASRFVNIGELLGFGLTYSRKPIAKTIKDLVFKLIHMLSQNIQVKFVMLLWNIWCHHNDKIWNQTIPNTKFPLILPCNITMNGLMLADQRT